MWVPLCGGDGPSRAGAYKLASRKRNNDLLALKKEVRLEAPEEATQALPAGSFGYFIASQSKRGNRAQTCIRQESHLPKGFTQDPSGPFSGIPVRLSGQNKRWLRSTSDA
jgi:hypothetical protein